MSLDDLVRGTRKRIGNLYWDHYNKDQFLRSCAPSSRVLDVGCGNNSPMHFKSVRPDFHYVGLDVGDYRQSRQSLDLADEYVVVPADQFAAWIESMKGRFNAIVSAHNIEHCLEPDRTLRAMVDALREGGRLFMSFPCEESIKFPHRGGTLNFFDDPTHLQVPNFNTVRSIISEAGLIVDVAIRRYRPLVRVLEGLRNEYRSIIQKQVMKGTWALYGFESIIWARRPAG